MYRNDYYDKKVAYSALLCLLTLHTFISNYAALILNFRWAVDPSLAPFTHATSGSTTPSGRPTTSTSGLGGAAAASSSGGMKPATGGSGGGVAPPLLPIVLLCPVHERPSETSLNSMYAGSTRWMARVNWVSVCHKLKLAVAHDLRLGEEGVTV